MKNIEGFLTKRYNTKLTKANFPISPYFAATAGLWDAEGKRSVFNSIDKDAKEFIERHFKGGDLHGTTYPSTELTMPDLVEVYKKIRAGETLSEDEQLCYDVEVLEGDFIEDEIEILEEDGFNLIELTPVASKYKACWGMLAKESANELCPHPMTLSFKMLRRIESWFSAQKVKIPTATPSVMELIRNLTTRIEALEND